MTQLAYPSIVGEVSWNGFERRSTGNVFITFIFFHFYTEELDFKGSARADPPG